MEEIMREQRKWTDYWKFIKEDIGIEKTQEAQGETVNLPNTWNARDGQD